MKPERPGQALREDSRSIAYKFIPYVVGGLLLIATAYVAEVIIA